MDVDQPLDAFIQTKKTGRGRGRGRGNRFGRGGRGGRNRGGQRGGFNQASNRLPPRQMGGKWQHDMYQGDMNGFAQAQTPGGRMTGGGGGGAKLIISNLDYGVSDDDIRELFREFGRLRKAEVHYDKSGRSVGTAHVIFERNVDAIKALKQYHGVPLDGRPMEIQQMDSSGQFKTPGNPNKTNVRQRVGTRPVTVRGGTTRGGGSGVRRGGGGGRGGRKAVPTAEQLDADLDAYKQSSDSWLS